MQFFIHVYIFFSYLSLIFPLEDTTSLYILAIENYLLLKLSDPSAIASLDKAEILDSSTHGFVSNFTLNQLGGGKYSSSTGFKPPNKDFFIRVSSRIYRKLFLLDFTATSKI